MTVVHGAGLRTSAGYTGRGISLPAIKVNEDRVTVVATVVPTVDTPPLRR
jgi:hypothetical protein